MMQLGTNSDEAYDLSCRIATSTPMSEWSTSDAGTMMTTSPPKKCAVSAMIKDKRDEEGMTLQAVENQKWRPAIGDAEKKLAPPYTFNPNACARGTRGPEDLNAAEEAILWQSGLFGDSTADSMLLTTWYYFTTICGVRGRYRHRSILIGDVNLLVYPDDGLTVVSVVKRDGLPGAKDSMCVTGSNYMPLPQREGPNDPVRIVKALIALRPDDATSSAFYLQPTSAGRNGLPSALWFYSNPLGVNTLGAMHNRITEAIRRIRGGFSIIPPPSIKLEPSADYTSNPKSVSSSHPSMVPRGPVSRPVTVTASPPSPPLATSYQQTHEDGSVSPLQFPRLSPLHRLSSPSHNSQSPIPEKRARLEPGDDSSINKSMLAVMDAAVRAMSSLQSPPSPAASSNRRTRIAVDRGTGDEFSVNDERFETGGTTAPLLAFVADMRLRMDKLQEAVARQGTSMDTRLSRLEQAMELIAHNYATTTSPSSRSQFVSRASGRNSPLESRSITPENEGTTLDEEPEMFIDYNSPASAE